MEDEQVIIFDKESRHKILSIMGKRIDSKGFIVEKSDMTQNVVTKDGEKIKFSEFAGVRKGSEIFIQNDINSILELSDLIWYGFLR